MMRRNVDKKIIRVLDDVVNKITIGYTHENYIEIGYLIKILEPVLDRNEILFLEAAWRDSYTDSCNQKKLEYEINKIKARLI